MKRMKNTILKTNTTHNRNASGEGKTAKNKGFSLVEILVVLVIMAILAAVAIPSLTGFIDEAKGKSHTEEVRTIYTAAQAALSECYGMDPNYKDKLTGNFYMGDKTTKAGRVTNFALYCVQNDPNALASTVDKAIATSVLKYLNSYDKNTAEYVFKKKVNPLKQNVNDYQKNNNQPGIVIAYNMEGKVLMVEFGIDGYLYEINDGKMTITKDGTFHSYPEEKRNITD